MRQVSVILGRLVAAIVFISRCDALRQVSVILGRLIAAIVFISRCDASCRVSVILGGLIAAIVFISRCDASLRDQRVGLSSECHAGRAHSGGGPVPRDVRHPALPGVHLFWFHHRSVMSDFSKQIYLDLISCYWFHQVLVCHS